MQIKFQDHTTKNMFKMAILNTSFTGYPLHIMINTKIKN